MPILIVKRIESVGGKTIVTLIYYQKGLDGVLRQVMSIKGDV